RAFDDFGSLSQQLRQLSAHEFGREGHRFVRTVLVLEDAERSALTIPGIQPVVANEALGLADDGHELFLDEPINLGTVLLVEVVMADDGKHETSFASRTRDTCQLIVPAGRSRARPASQSEKRDEFLMCSDCV